MKCLAALARANIKLMGAARAGCFILLGLLTPRLVLQARELVCLRSGFCIEAASHIISENMLLIQSGRGTLEFPADQMESIVALPDLEQAARTLVETPAAKVANTAISSEQLLIDAAIREGLEPEFVRSVAMVESGLKQNATSSKGAMGLMQLMPRTAVELGINPSAADQNALGGAAFLRQLLLKYKGDSALALAAYNAGPGTVDKYRGVPPYVETHRYIMKVLQEYSRQRQMQTGKNLETAKANIPQ